MSLTAPYAPVVISQASLAFPADVTALMPAYRSVKPDPVWRDLQMQWFFRGLPPETQFVPREGIDPSIAMRHLSAIQRSFQPKHEHKEEAVAFLLGQWFKKVVTPDRTYAAASVTA